MPCQRAPVPLGVLVNSARDSGKALKAALHAPCAQVLPHMLQGAGLHCPALAAAHCPVPRTGFGIAGQTFHQLWPPTYQGLSDLPMHSGRGRGRSPFTSTYFPSRTGSWFCAKWSSMASGCVWGPNSNPIALLWTYTKNWDT